MINFINIKFVIKSKQNIMSLLSLVVRYLIYEKKYIDRENYHYEDL